MSTSLHREGRYTYMFRTENDVKRISPVDHRVACVYEPEPSPTHAAIPSAAPPHPPPLCARLFDYRYKRATAPRIAMSAEARDACPHGLPRTYAGSAVAAAAALCPALSQPYVPTPWCAGASAQFALQQSRVALHAVTPPQFADETLSTRDGETLRIRWLHAPSPKGVAVLLHGITGCALDMTETATALQEAGWSAAAFERRGHGLPLTQPRFNTTGCVEDLRLVLDSVRVACPGVPVCALAVSAGCSLLIRYLGEAGEASAIDSAVCVCTGFGLARSLRAIDTGSVGQLMLWRMKSFFLERNRTVLAAHPATSALAAADGLVAWHEHQWRLSGDADEASYYRQHRTQASLRRVRVPTLFINADDDFVFPPDVSDGFLLAPRLSPWLAAVRTAAGGHATYFEGPQATSWVNRVALEWVDATLQDKLEHMRL